MISDLDVNPAIMLALENAENDKGALFEGEVLYFLRQLRGTDPAKWQRVRQIAKEKKVQISQLDLLTRGQQKGSSGQAFFGEVSPWADEVVGAELLLEICATVQKYVVCGPVTAKAAALWIAQTWFIDEVSVAPIANITAPLPNCGKSTLLEVFEKLCFQPLKCDAISPAALFRAMDKWQPTLLIDEVDAFLRDNEEARGILNSGHKRNGSVIRVVGDDHEPTRFSTWGAKALCGIGSIASTLRSRSITFELRRKLPHESVENIRHADPALFERLRRQLSRLRQDLSQEVALYQPGPLEGLNNRAQDNWEPLMQVADVVGGEWPSIVREAALELTLADDDYDERDLSLLLLKDIKDVFDSLESERILTSHLLERLFAMSHSPWQSLNKGKPIAPRGVARILSGYRIRPKDMRVGDLRGKGYEKGDFSDAFKRYLNN